MRYVIQTAISHSHIKYQITTVGSHGCIININKLYRTLKLYLFYQSKKVSLLNVTVK